MEKLEKEALYLQFIGKFPPLVDLVDPGNEVHQLQIQGVILLGKHGIIPRIQIPRKAGEGDLDDDGPVGFWRCDGVDLIGIHNDKIRGL